MAEHEVTRTLAFYDGEGNQLSGPIDPLIAFYWARLDEEPDSTDVRAKKAILDDYAHQCADTSNPAREVICGVTRTVIRHLATVYADHPHYRTEWTP